MPPRSKAQGESKQGLIITLVFFILATIGLGVATYYGFAEQTNLEKKAADAKKSEDAFKTERDWYKFQAMMYRSYIGRTEGMDGLDSLGTLKGQFTSGSMKGGKDRDDVKKVLDGLDAKLGWNGNQPKETLESTIERLKKEKETLANRNVNLENDLTARNKKLQSTEEELNQARKDYGDKLTALTNDLKRDFEKSTKDLTDFRGEVEKKSEELSKLQKELEDTKGSLAKQLAKKDAEIRDLRDLSQRKQEEMDQFRLRNPEAPASMRTDWKIIRMDTRGMNPYINLGSSDQVRPQLTFTIHSVGADGRPTPRPKGTLEVVNVIGPHLSQARITSVKDRDRDPVTQGDVLYNGSWNPSIKKHVAIAGMVDLTGDGRDNLYEFMRNLERQNIVVDAYLDPKDGSIKGKIGFHTDYLIVGSLSDAGQPGKAGEAEKQVALAQKQMQEEAKKYGVQVKGLVSYLEMIGYRLPRSSREGTSALYNPSLRPDLTPRVGGDNNPPPAAPDK